jgi:hypothetical protein
MDRRRTLVAILLTIALAVLIITALALMFYGSRRDREPLWFRRGVYPRMDGLAMAVRGRLRLLSL